MTFDDATLRQITAANPNVSTWVSANAGSGKTRVLTDRVARLLFQGVPPQRILCLTYTKAAASEMQNRLFQRLGGWAMKPDDVLRRELAQMGESGPLTSDDLRRARQMFATAIETPGGLKIQTIHSFCAGVLRRFPLEAGVSPQFREIDDRTARRLRGDILNAMAADERGPLLDGIGAVSATDIDAFTRAITNDADRLSKTADKAAVFASFGLPPDAGPQTLDALYQFTDDDSAVVSALSRAAFTATNDLKLQTGLRPISGRPLYPGDAPALESLFLFRAAARNPHGPKIGKLPTDQAKALVADHLEQLDDLMQRVADARDTRLALASAERTWALHLFATAFLAEYSQRKLLAGWLDFDDLILKTRDLLSDPQVAAWVLFRLDGGIDHILVDEAQDTNPDQWKVIEHLAAEFTSGAGARAGTARTLFVVGDRKQSIYSFHGAAPDAFDHMSDIFGDRLAQIQAPLERVVLTHSFRSAPAILEFVDRTLAPATDAGLGRDLSHIAFHTDRPGRVDLWPMFEAEKDETQSPEWFRPVDSVAPNAPAVRLADAIAAEIRATLERGDQITGKDGPRPITAGDFLILVQKRSGPHFTQILRALKAARLPVAGSDQLTLDAELAVSDLRSLLAFLALPQDDLSLAEALRSPLCGWSEAALYDIAQPRANGASLWDALRDARGADDPTLAMLTSLRGRSDFLRPFDLIDLILTRHHGRRKLLSRLGPEAEEGIDVLLGLALNYERTEVPTLAGFLTWLDVEEIKVKRQMDNVQDQIRVMTVHGAKGLEAPIVILPDTHNRRRNASGDAILTDDAGFVWKPSAPEMSARSIAALDAKKVREAEEDNRLLYVAMTRAESWLILCGAGKPSDTAWHNVMRAGMDVGGGVTLETPAGPGQRFETGVWPAALPRPIADRSGSDDAIPDWAEQIEPAPPRPRKTLSPSGLDGDKALAGDSGQDRDTAMQRGTDLHLLLEHLPGHDPAKWPALSRQLLGDRPDLPDLLADATRVIQAPALAHVFTQTAMTEVGITANLDRERLRGSIDRLIVTDTHILAVDYKSNALVPGTPDQTPLGILRQMGAYLTALRQIYPTHSIDVAILWTTTATLMPLKHDIVMNALRSPPTS